jgi:hypothetical protein
MIGNTMLKKRLRVFANIASENEVENKRKKNEDTTVQENSYSSYFNFDSFPKTSDLSLELLDQNKKSFIRPNSNKITESSLNNSKSQPEEYQSDSNCLIINFPFKISEDNIYSVLIFYGEVESLVMSPKENGGLE